MLNSFSCQKINKPRIFIFWPLLNDISSSLSQKFLMLVIVFVFSMAYENIWIDSEISFALCLLFLFIKEIWKKGKYSVSSDVTKIYFWFAEKPRKNV